MLGRSKLDWDTSDQVFCPRCKGGNAREAARCLWCDSPLDTVIRIRRIPLTGKAPIQLGIALLLCAGLILIGLGLWAVAGGSAGGSAAVTAWGIITSPMQLVILVALILGVFAVPGLVLLLVGRRHSKALHAWY